jgi:hypothetical protein
LSKSPQSIAKEAREHSGLRVHRKFTVILLVGDEGRHHLGEVPRRHKEATGLKGSNQHCQHADDCNAENQDQPITRFEA